MNRRNFVWTALVSFASLFLAACGKGTANTNPTGSKLNYKTISQAALDTLNSLLTSFNQLRPSNPQYGAAADALTKILAIASPIVATLQSTTFPAPNSQQLVTQIENLVTTAAAILTPTVLPASVSIAINLGIGIFRTLEPLILGSSGAPAGAAADVSSEDSPAAKLAKLKAYDTMFKGMAGR